VATDEPKFKLRRAVAPKKNNHNIDAAVSLGAKSNMSTYSADVSDSSSQTLDAICLRNQQSGFSAGGGSTSSNHSRKRRREFLDLAGDNNES